MSYFESIRAEFEKQGLRINCYAARLGGSEAEIDRQFLMAKALGVSSINARIPESITSVVAAAAEKHRLIVGFQFSDVKLMERQLAASKYFRMDPDIGDMTKAKIDALQFVQGNYQSMSSLDLKDAVLGGVSVPFGEGDSRMKQVLLFLKEKKVSTYVYVDCDYAGTGRSTEEVTKCVSYARSSLRTE
jgi:L-ribulose-5-phosphate 3-epimerase UlaE